MSEFDYNPTINVKSRIRKLNDRKEHLTKTSELVLGSSNSYILKFPPSYSINIGIVFLFFNFFKISPKIFLKLFLKVKKNIIINKNIHFNNLFIKLGSGMNNFQNTGGFNNTGNFSNSGNDVGGYIPR